MAPPPTYRKGYLKINGAPPSVTSERLQVERAGPQGELNRALKWQKQEQDASDREPSARRDRLPGHQDRASLVTVAIYSEADRDAT